MKITDITGTIKNGMWSYGSPILEVNIEQVSSVADGDDDTNFAIEDDDRLSLIDSLIDLKAEELKERIREK